MLFAIRTVEALFRPILRATQIEGEIEVGNSSLRWFEEARLF
jgi:hypothetical protein